MVCIELILYWLVQCYQIISVHWRLYMLWIKVSTSLQIWSFSDYDMKMSVFFFLFLQGQTYAQEKTRRKSTDEEDVSFDFFWAFLLVLGQDFSISLCSWLYEQWKNTLMPYHSFNITVELGCSMHFTLGRNTELMYCNSGFNFQS